MIIFLTVICLILILILSLILHDIKRITKDLNYINKNDTNGEVTTGTSLPIIKKLAQACNFNLNETHQLKEKQAIQNRQFNQMLTNLTHDIKTPLTVSIGYVQLLTQQSTGKNQRDLVRVQGNLDSVNYYLHYLMDFNLIREKSKNLSVTQFNLSDTLQKELFNYYDQLTAKHINAQIEIAPKVIVNSDEMMFKRIFQNLIGNILKYASNDMDVTLKNEDGIVKLSFENQTNENIHDSNQLLNRFYTADNSRTNHSVGLGLSIVQSLVTTLGGRVNLETDHNKFKVILIFKHLQTQKS
ncbi:sensor histidine kinase [Companilactobacillus kimchii]|uniref:histidine kinase n=1 Tax=Companilactobacillus kimchii TaxID=2801452 RepID=A0A210PD96_9LACO|nr:HAMP domain-containing sensor histidine kinase [Companilactobacillus kimchii]KAE9562303.1 histidine kinase [Companilactobacillus kimchii]OWF34453.1 Sensor histidine kinase YcbM [Companilactobacillus kimchii]GEO46377.1 two-component sensor histidine kinase [Companilactobacillus paralimentarius]